MSASQRILPLLVAGTVGLISGVYIFDPLLRQYAKDTKGTFDPEVAKANSPLASAKAAIGGTGGGSSPIPDSPLGASNNSSTTNSAGGMGEGISRTLGMSESQDRATQQREMAVKNAAARAVESAQSRAQKTGDGKVL